VCYFALAHAAAIKPCFLLCHITSLPFTNV